MLSAFAAAALQAAAEEGEDAIEHMAKGPRQHEARCPDTSSPPHVNCDQAALLAPQRSSFDSDRSMCHAVQASPPDPRTASPALAHHLSVSAGATTGDSGGGGFDRFACSAASHHQGHMTVTIQALAPAGTFTVSPPPNISVETREQAVVAPGELEATMAAQQPPASGDPGTSSPTASPTLPTAGGSSGADINGDLARVASTSPITPTTAPTEPQTGTVYATSLDALVAACEWAAAQEGLEEGSHFFEELMGGAAPAPLHGAAEGHEAAAPPAAAKYRRHKSKVFIRPNKVVYLPTTFVEEALDPAALPLECRLLVEVDGVDAEGDAHAVTVKAVPRAGLATMYCMTNVQRFQQQYLNWQITHWTRVDAGHIKVHLAGPTASGPAAAAGTTQPPAALPATTAAHRRAATAAAAAAPTTTTTATGHGLARSHSSSARPAGELQARATRGLAAPATPAAPAPANNHHHPAAQQQPEPVRRSSRALRLTAQMLEHLEQEGGLGAWATLARGPACGSSAGPAAPPAPAPPQPLGGDGANGALHTAPPPPTFLLVQDLAALLQGVAAAAQAAPPPQLMAGSTAASLYFGGAAAPAAATGPAPAATATAAAPPATINAAPGGPACIATPAGAAAAAVLPAAGVGMLGPSMAPAAPQRQLARCRGPAPPASAKRRRPADDQPEEEEEEEERAGRGGGDGGGAKRPRRCSPPAPAGPQVPPPASSMDWAPAAPYGIFSLDAAGLAAALGAGPGM